MIEQWTKIVVARHGETDQNALNLLLSRNDVPLNKVGREQALGLKNNLKDFSFVACYSSPLKRAQETAQLIVGGRLPVQVDKRLIERDFGDLEGTSYEDTKDVRQTFLENNKRTWKNNPEKNPLMIETDAELKKRVIPFLKEIAQAHLGIANLNLPKGDVLVTSHSGIMRYLLNYLGYSYKDSKGKKIPNCSYIILESNGKDIRLADTDNSTDFEWLKKLVYTK